MPLLPCAISPASALQRPNVPPEESLAKLHVLVNGDPAGLLEHAAEAFLRAPRHPVAPSTWPPYVLVLRQGGLRDDLFELAAARGVPGWFDPPVCVFHELPAWLGASELRPLGDFERAALLGSIMRAGAGPTFRDRESDFLGAVEQLFSELRSEAVTPDAYAAAVASLDERERFEQDRDAELVRLYTAYVRELERLGRRDGRDALADTATAVRASPASLAERLGGRREIRILGLADLRGGWRQLLSALTESPALDRIVLYLTGELPVSPELVSSIERIPGTGIAAEPVTPASARAGRFGLVSEPDVDRELEAVSSKVRALIDAGTSPHRIAVVFREARPYGDFAIRALADAGVPATARRRIAFREIPAVRAVLALLEAGAEGWTRHGLAELGSQPYFAGDVDARVVNFIGHRERVAGLDGWTAALDRLLSEARAAEASPADESERRARALPSRWVERAAERFRSFTAMAAAIEGEHPVAGWLEWLAGWLEQDSWRIEERIMRAPAAVRDLRGRLPSAPLKGAVLSRGVARRGGRSPGAIALGPIEASAWKSRSRAAAGGTVNPQGASVPLLPCAISPASALPRPKGSPCPPPLRQHEPRASRSRSLASPGMTEGR